MHRRVPRWHFLVLLYLLRKCFLSSNLLKCQSFRVSNLSLLSSGCGIQLNNKVHHALYPFKLQHFFSEYYLNTRASHASNATNVCRSLHTDRMKISGNISWHNSIIYWHCCQSFSAIMSLISFLFFSINTLLHREVSYQFAVFMFILLFENKIPGKC